MLFSRIATGLSLLGLVNLPHSALASPTPIEAKIIAEFRSLQDCEVSKYDDKDQEIALTDDEILSRITAIEVTGKDYSGAVVRSTLYQVLCAGGNYNVDYVFFAPIQKGVTSISFAQPEWKTDSKTQITKISGMSSAHHLINASYDNETKRLLSTTKTRGIGDAFSAFTYKLSYTGELINTILLKAVVDDLEDGKIKPFTIFQIK